MFPKDSDYTSNGITINYNDGSCLELSHYIENDEIIQSNYKFTLSNDSNLTLSDLIKYFLKDDITSVYYLDDIIEKGLTDDGFSSRSLSSNNIESYFTVKISNNSNNTVLCISFYDYIKEMM